MDDLRYLKEGLFVYLNEEKFHAYRKFEFCNCPWLSNRLVDGRTILFYQELSSGIKDSAN